MAWIYFFKEGGEKKKFEISFATTDIPIIYVIHSIVSEDYSDSALRSDNSPKLSVIFWGDHLTDPSSIYLSHSNA